MEAGYSVEILGLIRLCSSLSCPLRLMTMATRLWQRSVSFLGDSGVDAPLKLVDPAAAKYQTKRQVCGVGTVTPKGEGKWSSWLWSRACKSAEPHGEQGGYSHFSPGPLQRTGTHVWEVLQTVGKRNFSHREAAENYTQGGILRVTPGLTTSKLLGRTNYLAACSRVSLFISLLFFNLFI